MVYCKNKLKEIKSNGMDINTLNGKDIFKNIWTK